MPELPEVETTRRGIAPYLENAKIKKIIVRQPRLRYPVPIELQQFENIAVLSTSRRAKYLIIHTEKGFLIGHLGMSGSLRVVDERLEPSKHDHLDFILNNGKIIRYNDPRRFGAWLWVERLEDCEMLQKLGVEPLSDNFNVDYFFQYSRRKMPIKTLLMHNPVLVGVGNIYANECLFLCGIHPKTPSKNLTFCQCEQLVQTIKKVLNKAIQQGGTTLKDFHQVDGKPGYFAQELFVYGKKGQPCPKCQTEIESVVIAQRNTFFCPSCQG